MTALLLIVTVPAGILAGWLWGRGSGRADAFSAQEVRDLVAGHDEITADERELIEDVFAAGERQLREVLVPRTEVEFLDGSLPLSKAARQVASSPHSRFPVYTGNHDDVIGFVHVRDLLNPSAMESDRPLSEAVRPVLYLPAGRKVLPVMSEMRRDGRHLAIVIDEYGGTAGIVTLEDLVEELIGDIRDEYDVGDTQARRFQNGVVEVDGLTNTADFADETGITLPGGPYETVGGYLMAVLGHVPGAGESTVFERHRLEITEMDRRRVARVRVTPLAGPDPGPEEADEGATINGSVPTRERVAGVVPEDEVSGRIGT
ncbi:hemolysin family protein [Actinocorallia longicatena]|uniref:CBS domain-containing protein n=1 Tax=Actinocorallia longicatena TaxID=111803 RepID=A0ABP6QHY7_9ACTN